MTDHDHDWKYVKTVDGYDILSCAAAMRPRRD